MFKGIPKSFNKNLHTQSGNLPANTSLLPVLAHEKLLNGNKRQEILANIRKLVSLPTLEYEAFYLKAIINFAEFAQQLPETAYSYYSHPGGLLDHGLERACLALSLCRSYLVPAQTGIAELAPEYERWLYAIFTAALLLDVGKAATKEEVTLFNQEKQKIGLWQPSCGSMLTQAAYYQYDFLKENLDRLRNLYTPLLARQLLSNTVPLKSSLSGFDWIAADKEVLEAWLAILSGEQTGGSYLLTIIPIAQAQTIANYFAEQNKNLLSGLAIETPQDNTAKTTHQTISSNEAPLKTPSSSQPATTTSLFQPNEVAGTAGYTVATATTAIVTGSVASTIAPTLTAGEAFINWLKRNIHLQTWVNNPNAPIQRVKEGLFLSHPKLIQEFCRENPKYGSWQTVHEQFLKLDLALDGGKVQTYYNRNSNYKKLQEGILVNAFLFLSETQLSKIPVNNSFIKLTEQALELKIAQKLNANAALDRSPTSKT